MTSEIIPWWEAKKSLKGSDLVRALFSKTWAKLGDRILVMFPDRLKDIYYSAGRLSALECQREYLNIGKQPPPKTFKETIELIHRILKLIIVPLSDVKITRLHHVFNEDYSEITIYDNPYASGTKTEEPSCYFLTGFIEAMVEYFSERNKVEGTITVEETECAAVEGNHCTWAIKIVHKKK